MPTTMIIALVVFAVSYIVMLSEKVHRTVIAMFSAALLILLGVLNQHQAIDGIDFNMLGILIGMMIIVGIAKHSGIFQYVAIQAAKIGKGKPIPIFFLFAVMGFIFSAILDDVTTVLLMVPVTFVIANNLKVNPKPFLFSSILMANIGGSATLIGDQPNILIGSAAELSFNEFIWNMGPIAFITGVVTLGLLILIFKKDLVADPEAQERIMRFKPKEAITNKPLLYKSLLVIFLVITGFILHDMLHIEGATLAMGGAALLLLLTMDEPEEYIKDIEWPTIFFFIGLFILVTGLDVVGVIRIMAEWLIESTGGNPSTMTVAILWGSGIFSAIVDNVPFVAVMIPLVKDVGALTSIPVAPLWWALSMGSGYGGNATLIGASANVVVSGMAEKAGHKIKFLDFMKTAVPLSLISLLLSTAYLYLRYL